MMRGLVLLLVAILCLRQVLLVPRLSSLESSAVQSNTYGNNPKEWLPVSPKLQPQEVPRKPKVILHIGPHKTGTSTLQWFTKRQSTELWQDGIWIPQFDGVKAPYFALAHCMIDNYRKGGGDYAVNFCNNNLFPKLQKQLADFSSSNATRPDILVIAEDLDRPTIRLSRIKRYFRSYTTTFEIIVTYRRLHDWLPSWYNEIMSLYLGTFTSVSDKKTMPSFVSFVERKFEQFLKRHFSGLIDQYHREFESIKFFNFHGTPGSTDLVSNYICSTLAANHTCQQLLERYQRNNVTESEVVRGSQPMELYRLVIAAFWKGLLTVTKPSTSVVRELAYKWRSSLRSRTSILEDDWYRVCVNETLWQRVWDESEQLESSFFPHMSPNLKESFDAARNPKWCVYNEEMLFSNRTLLEDLGFCSLTHVDCLKIK